MPHKTYKPKPIFDTLSETIDYYQHVYAADNPRNIIEQRLEPLFVSANMSLPAYAIKDYQLALNFLNTYRGSSQTFNAYRRDIERLLQWSWFVQEQSILKHRREDIEVFMGFCIKPYKRWIGLKTVARFKVINGNKVNNPDWHPFEARLSKQETKAGQLPTKDDYAFSQQSIRALFAVLSSFYQYGLQEGLLSTNPVMLIRQKSKFLRKEASMPVIRRLSDKQWQTVLDCAINKANENKRYERDVFLLYCLYSMYLRISELVTTERWSPVMGHFFQDGDENWWFKVLGKGNKLRQIAVSDAMMAALKHYRVTYLNLSPYPAIGEKTPLIGQSNNYNIAITSDRPIRQWVQSAFDRAAVRLSQSGLKKEAVSLASATVHWLRHTGISDDVKIRPREHVRDDAGHSSGAITDRYIDVELKARAKSAKNKPIKYR